jgi:hypothetical protein
MLGKLSVMDIGDALLESIQIIPVLNLKDIGSSGISNYQW